MDLSGILENNPVKVSVPCRVDFGGTLDISTFYLPLAHLNPVGFNMAVDLRTTVTLTPHRRGRIKVSSRGFDSAEFDHGNAPFDHPMGLMFACAQYFNAHGVHIQIDSASPPRSALGGSSSAAVAILAAFHAAFENPVDPAQVAWLAHYIESSVAGVPCGVQDQVAAAFGGAHMWAWKMGDCGPVFDRFPVFETDADRRDFASCMRVAYCGIPHESKDINSRWVSAFVQGKNRTVFARIIELTRDFYIAVRTRAYQAAADLMTQETRLRLDMTPDVLDDTGKKLFDIACAHQCGARFTGAGGGGCLWAVGGKTQIASLANDWQSILQDVPGAALLDTRIDPAGILVH
ncbi:MAG: galactokinase [Desulfotignum sp.]|nr:galactokinase [Desulfotignum sp.]MCF8086927.1 galactokinase [Desulfotignum sp.]MCF8137211.1 galactokinase [Desulfotignum sp.]